MLYQSQTNSIEWATKPLENNYRAPSPICIRHIVRRIGRLWMILEPKSRLWSGSSWKVRFLTGPTVLGHIEAKAKRLPVRHRHIQIYFRERQLLYMNSNYEVWSQGSNGEEPSISSNNDWVPNRRLAIIWTCYGLAYWHTHTHTHIYIYIYHSAFIRYIH